MKKVETYLDTEGGFCGLVLKSDAGDVLVNTTGCPNGSPDTPHVDIDIPTDYQLAGFMQYDNGTEPHILVPVLYRKYKNEIENLKSKLFRFGTLNFNCCHFSSEFNVQEALSASKPIFNRMRASPQVFLWHHGPPRSISFTMPKMKNS